MLEGRLGRFVKVAAFLDDSEDVFAMMRIPWTSDRATQLNREIFEIYFQL